MIRLIRWLYLNVVKLLRMIINLLGYIVELLSSNNERGKGSKHMNYSNKNIQKCVRLTQKTFDYVNSFDGNGFNQKFENACNYFENSQNRIDIQIKASEKELERIRHDIYKMSKLLSNVSYVTDYMKLVESIVSQDMPKLIPPGNENNID